MNILIIEDDESKQGQIKSFLKQLPLEIKISSAKSYHSGLQSILEKSPDLILLDMTMPTYDIDSNEDGGRPQHFAGREIFRQMGRRNVSIPVIVITMFEFFGEGPDSLTRTQLDHQLKIDHPHNYQGTVYYNVASNTWKKELEELLMDILGIRK